MKLSEIKGEQALDILADLLEPATEIITDEELRDKFREDDKLGAVKIALKGHKTAVIQIMALLDGQNPAEYEVNLFTLPKKLLEIFNDPLVVDLFSSQGQNEDENSSGSATVNTEGAEQ